MTRSITRHVPSASAALVSAVAFGETARRARTRTIGTCEEHCFRSINDAPDALHVPVWAVMQLGSLAGVYAVGAALARTGRTADAVATTLAGTAMWGGVKLIKGRIGRGRPTELLDEVSVRGPAQTGIGYPSGHAAVAATLALIAPIPDPAIRAAALLVAGGVGGARIYVGAHLPLDVAGGLALGVLGGLAARALLDMWP